MTDEAKKNIDWELVEKHYRAGLLSLREIAKKTGITEAAVRKRAKRDEWAPRTRVVAEVEDRTIAVNDLVPEENVAKAPGYIYVVFIHTGSEFFYKIGLARNVNERLKGHQTSSPFEVRLAIAYFVPNMRAEEQMLHSLLADKCVRGEWFRLEREDLELIAKRSLLA